MRSLHKAAGMKRAITWIVIVAVLGAAGYFGYRWYRSRSAAPAESYRTAAVKRTDVVSQITATGTLVPEDVIDVGAQVNGPIASFGNDLAGKIVDYRSEVREGMVLAKIDQAVYEADVAADEARLAQAEAQVRVAQANKTQAVARLEQGRRDWERAQRLSTSRALAQADIDAAKSEFEQAEANLAVQDAGIMDAQASVAVAQAALKRSRRNLAFCTIASPVDGVIIDRRVEIGQTVVASLNAPSLFLIAKDLRKMKVLVQVNEAVIGSVRDGEKVNFSVDAFPDDRFTGTVRKVRLNATMTQNVVTYTVEVETDNADLKLLPYLTANVRFEIARQNATLAVPNSALRYEPANLPPGTTVPDADAPGVWVIAADGSPRRISATPGVSDGSVTAVASAELKEGDTVILGEAVASQTPGAAASPFAPPMRGGGGGGRGSGGRR